VKIDPLFLKEVAYKPGAFVGYAPNPGIPLGQQAPPSHPPAPRSAPLARSKRAPRGLNGRLRRRNALSLFLFLSFSLRGPPGGYGTAVRQARVPRRSRTRTAVVQRTATLTRPVVRHAARRLARGAACCAHSVVEHLLRELPASSIME
jgi:hypothetical protein